MKQRIESRTKLSWLRRLARLRLMQISEQERSNADTDRRREAEGRDDALPGQGLSKLRGAPVMMASLVLLASGCSTDLGPQPVLPVDPTNDTRGTKTSALTAQPLETGLLSISPDGAFAVASDDVGGVVHVVALGSDQLTSRAVTLEAGEHPGRAALNGTHAYVTLPQSGAVAVIDLANATVVDRLHPCPAPQGIALGDTLMHVACRGGELVSSSLADGSVQRSLLLDEDLRDVGLVTSGVLGQGLVVSRLAKAELIWLDASGTEIERSRPIVSSGNEAAVAWRTVVADDGVVFMAHQTDSDQDLGSGYAGGECGSIVAPTVTGFVPPGVAVEGRGLSTSEQPQQLSQLSILSGAGTFDLGIAGSAMTLVFPGNELARQFNAAEHEGDPTLPSIGEVHSIHHFTIGFDDDSTCVFSGTTVEQEPAVPISVAGTNAGPLAGSTLVLTHSPQKVRVLGTALEVVLSAADRQDTGQQLFQMTVGTGIACASCHPGGRADARTWRLANGPRRTQPLEGGVSHLGAFHWDAEFDTFDALVDDVMTERMGLHENLASDQKTALLGFLDRIPKPVLPAQSLDTEMVQRGRLLFESETTQCSTCHAGPALTNNLVADVGTGGAFVTPSLVGVGYREPLMHDGCASDLLDRFGPCGGGDRHGKTSHLTDAEVDELVAYMKTL